MGRPGGGPSAVLLATVLGLSVLVTGGCRTTTDEPAAAAALEDGARPADPTGEDRDRSVAAAFDRAISISTTSCGYAPSSEGFGIAISDDLVLTAAHVVAGSTEITVARPGQDDRTRTATVAAYDTLRDLALLEVDLSGWLVPADPIRFEVLGEGQRGLIIGDAEVGGRPFTVAQKTIIEMDEVRGTRRAQRSGYRLDAVTGPGDSGSGLFDGDGRLVGVLFAVSTDDERRSWATAADEVETFLADRSVRGDFTCNPDRSRLGPVAGG